MRVQKNNAWQWAMVCVVLLLGCSPGESKPMLQFESKFPSKDIFPPNTEADIAALEQRIGYKLPQDYRQFLLEHNGIEFEQHVGVALWYEEEYSDDPTCEIYELFGITEKKNDETWNFDVEELQKGYQYNLRVPAGYFAITDTLYPAHNFCISLNEEDYGAIYYWIPPSPFPDPDEDEEPYTKEYLEPMAKSFQEFWDNIRDLRELHIELEVDESWWVD